MKFRHYKAIVSADLYRIAGKHSFIFFLKQMLIGEAFPYVFWLRTSQFSRASPLLVFWLYPFSRLRLRSLGFKLGISIPWYTKISPGLFIGHFGAIVVNGDATIGANCNLSQGVTIGQSNRGDRAGCPVLGDNVYIGPGAKLIGAIKIGNNVAIGANAVVTKDVPDNAVVAGVPAKIISMNGVEGYISHIDY